MIRKIMINVGLLVGIFAGFTHSNLIGMKKHTRRQSEQQSQLSIVNKAPYDLAIEYLTGENAQKKTLLPDQEMALGTTEAIQSISYKPINAGFIADRWVTPVQINLAPYHTSAQETNKNLEIIISHQPAKWYNLPKFTDTMEIKPTTKPQEKLEQTELNELPWPYGLFQALQIALKNHQFIPPQDLRTETGDSRVPPHLILNVPANADKETIEAAYKKIKKSLHKPAAEEALILDKAYEQYIKMIDKDSYQQYLDTLRSLGIYNVEYTLAQLRSLFPSLDYAIETNQFMPPEDLETNKYDDRIPPHLILGISADTPPAKAAVKRLDLERRWRNNAIILALIESAYNRYVNLVERDQYQDYLKGLIKKQIYNPKITLSDLRVIFPSLDKAIKGSQLILPKDVRITDSLDSRIPPHLIFGVDPNANKEQIDQAYQYFKKVWSKNPAIMEIINNTYKQYIRMLGDAYQKYLKNLYDLKIYIIGRK